MRPSLLSVAYFSLSLEHGGVPGDQSRQARDTEALNSSCRSTHTFLTGVLHPELQIPGSAVPRKPLNTFCQPSTLGTPGQPRIRQPSLDLWPTIESIVPVPHSKNISASLG